MKRDPIQLDYQAPSRHGGQRTDRMPLWLEYVQAGLILVIVVPGFVLLVIAIAWVLYAMFKVVY